MRTFLFVLTGLFLIMAASANEPAPVPKGAPPRFMTVGQVQEDKGLFTCLQVVEVPRVVMVERIVEVAGKKLVTLEQVMEMARETRSIAVSPAKARIASADGQAIAAADLWKKLKPGQTIVMSADGQNIDPAYLRVLQKDTVVVVMPQERPVVPIPQKLIPEPPVPEKLIPPLEKQNP